MIIMMLYIINYNIIIVTNFDVRQPVEILLLFK
jgi:hypothetical protein